METHMSDLEIMNEITALRSESEQWSYSTDQDDHRTQDLIQDLNDKIEHLVELIADPVDERLTKGGFRSAEEVAFLKRFADHALDAGDALFA
jgi:hypothetical protein